MAFNSLKKITNPPSDLLKSREKKLTKHMIALKEMLSH